MRKLMAISAENYPEWVHIIERFKECMKQAEENLTPEEYKNFLEVVIAKLEEEKDGE